MSRVRLKRFKHEFTFTGAQGLPLGTGTIVEVKELGAEEQVTNGHRELRIEATVKLSAVVTPVPEACTICGVRAPSPEHSEDALWFILRNHDGRRLVFSCEEDVKEERDAYPVTGWHRSDDGLLCGECHAELEETKKALRERKKGKS